MMNDLFISNSCPCCHTTPCSPDCTCVKPFSSLGCKRCCSYGSEEQKKIRAKMLAELIDKEHSLEYYEV